MIFLPAHLSKIPHTLKLLTHTTELISETMGKLIGLLKDVIIDSAQGRMQGQQSQQSGFNRADYNNPSYQNEQYNRNRDDEYYGGKIIAIFSTHQLLRDPHLVSVVADRCLPVRH